MPEIAPMFVQLLTVKKLATALVIKTPLLKVRLVAAVRVELPAIVSDPVPKALLLPRARLPLLRMVPPV